MFPRFFLFRFLMPFLFLWLSVAEGDTGSGGAGGDASGGTAGHDGKTGAGGTPGAAAVDVQAEVRKALEAREAEYAKKLEELTGHKSLDALHQANLTANGETEKLLNLEREKSAKFEGMYRNQAVQNALLSAAKDSVDPDTVAALLSGQAQVGDDGKVTIGGKDVAAAVADLLKSKPHLAKPAGGQGSGAGQGGAAQAGTFKAEYEAAKAKGDAKTMMDIKRRNGGKAP